MTRPYQVCTRCVMDTSDPQITFDEEGVCSHCHKFEVETRRRWFPNAEGERLWAEKLDEIKAAGRAKEYDCIIGLSGGVDSSYLALRAKEWGLRPLVVHVDAGWNSELAVSNVETIVKACGYDLHTIVIDWEEMRDLQLSYLKSGVSNQDVPQDHAFFASLYRYAVRNNVNYVMSGGNIATEGIFPDSWHGSAMDAINLKAIHRRFGTRALKAYPTVSFLEYYLTYPFVHGMRTVRPLNFMKYDKQQAVDTLVSIGWRPYGRKHGESRFTKLFQNYYLPERFGYDKRRPHLSSLIVSGQISRDEAAESLEEHLYAAKDLDSDLAYFCKKLGISRDDFARYMAGPKRSYSDFANWDGMQRAIKQAQQLYRRVRGRDVRIYS
ncbi:N-acetyl sugar amidotransferase [Devosia sp. ZB163]|uniref:N-acetyl sugar amidotransferase n=1 Tax=Devosia sp. ZB163 TaxID=3025938 RepID=UPI00235E48B4|nr:N-acetyl sugar amidotransferase [Devosia sp. ZB163]MDC9823045.1 N-acetyl sugar amidotransferase [Devosia sp. ZB163]